MYFVHSYSHALFQRHQVTNETIGWQLTRPQVDLLFVWFLTLQSCVNSFSQSSKKFSNLTLRNKQHHVNILLMTNIIVSVVIPLVSSTDSKIEHWYWERTGRMCSRSLQASYEICTKCLNFLTTMIKTEKLRKEDQVLWKEIQDLTNQLKKVTDDMCYYDFYFIYYFANCKLSLVSLSLNFIFCTHCPASNSLASCRPCYCNIICL